MRTSKFRIVQFSGVCITALVLICFCQEILVHGADSPTQQTKSSKEAIQEKSEKKLGGIKMPAYIPPRLGKPTGRIGGGTRGEKVGVPFLSVLTPDHTGLTTKAQPELYWYMSNPTKKPIEFTLNLEQEGKTIAHKIMKELQEEGIGHVRFSDLGIELDLNKEYTWFVTIVLDPNDPSADLFSGGAIMRVSPSEVFKKKLAEVNEMDIPAVYAEEGIWYDALSALSSLIDKDPQNKVLRMQRASLLEQVQREREAVFDRKSAGEDGAS